MMRHRSNAFRLCVLLGCAALALPAALSAQTYTVTSATPSPIASNTTGPSLTLAGNLPTNFIAPGFAYCFYTGYGSTIPITPSSVGPQVINVPTSSVNSIPSVAYTNGVFNALLYVVTTSAAVMVNCTGSSDGTLTNIYKVPIVQVPTLSSVDVPGLLQTNAATGVQPPPNTLIFTGTGLIGPSAAVASPTTVSYTWTGGGGAGTVKYGSGTTLVATVPATIPSTVTAIQATACNQTIACSSPLSIAVNALTSSTGTLTATPNPAAVQQNVVLAAQFQPGKPSAGAPTGTATFTSNGTALGTAKLLLDKTTAAFYTATGGGLATATPVTRLLKADLNADGIPDVMYFDANNTLHILLGATPFGAFQTEIVSNAVPGCGFVNNFAIGDINGDGFPDVVVSCGVINSDNFAAVMQGNGDGTFATAVALRGVYGSQVALADMDRDGVLDLVTGGPTAAAIVGQTTPVGLQVFKGKGDGTFSLSVTTTTPTKAIGTNLLVADLDKDGYPDIIELKNLTQNVQSIDVYASQAGTAYGSPSVAGNIPTASIALSNYPQIYNGLIAGDFNGDGLLDLGAYGSDPANTVVTALNTSKTGAISFAAQRNLVPAIVPLSVQAGDFNGDGFADLAVVSATSTTVYDSDGTGGFGTNYTGLKVTPASNINSAVAADINADGDSDLLLLTLLSGNTYTLTGYLTTGAANASFTTNYATSGTPTVAASWPGNTNITGSAPSILLPVNGAATNIVIQSSGSPTQYGQPVTFTATVTTAATGLPTGTVNFYDGGILLGPGTLVPATGKATYTTSTLTATTHTISAKYVGDTVFAGSTSANIPQAVTQALPVITWNPNPTNITYGTPLVAGQLNATAASTYFPTVMGSFNYTPAVGSVLGAGTQALNVTFTPTDTLDFKTATGTANISVGKATPTVTWNPPAAIVVGTPLSATQLNATATGINGTLFGTFNYTPASGTVLTAGANQPLSVLFTPTDVTDYNTASGNTTISVISLAVAIVAPNSATLGAGATPITLTGTGFLANSVVNVNGTPLATYAYVNATTMTATIPATLLATPQILNITVFDPTQNQTSAMVAFTVTAPPVTAVFTGPSTTLPAEQPSAIFTLTNPYPVALTGTATITFAGTGGANDPAIQFSSGGRTATFTIPANTTATPALPFQSGTDAGTITVTLVLTAGGQVVTPANIQPLNITVPPEIPSIASMTLTRSGNSVTVNITGFSNTREMVSGQFHFTAAAGSSISDADITVPASALFATWYTTAGSQTYGSNFLYSQTFNLSQDQSTIGSVTVTLTNTVGISTSITAQ